MVTKVFLYHLYANTKKDLGVLNVHRAWGPLTRSIIKHIEECEKCSMFFSKYGSSQG